MTDVLVIDDCLSTMELVEDALVNQGFSVKIAHTKEEVRKTLKKECFSLVVFDFNFWGIGGGAYTNELLAKKGYTPEQRILFTKYRSKTLGIASLRRVHPEVAERAEQLMNSILGEGVRIIDKDMGASSLSEGVTTLANTVASILKPPTA